MIDVVGLHVVLGHGSGRVHAVRGATFHVDEGATFGLVGESGSGKTTVLRAICGLDPPARGGIAIAGKPLPARRGMAFCRQVQMVFQDPYGSLHPRHTVDRILEEPLAIHRIDGVDRRIASILDEVGLGRRCRFRFPHQLSGGQRQRVAIARALVLEPHVLLLDEPTSALDVSVQAEILNLLADIRTHRRMTAVLVSHDLSVVSHMCDRLAVMKQGAVVEHLAVEALRRGEPQHPYTRQLLAASLGYDRAAVDGFRETTSAEDA
ncbi:ABC transporter ATP-binding protein [Desulfococcus sp.]|uniref:ABC transporter ATP-binding protein n=1 Tax=Desulfococcus sp. TaxID=2025834 RepID=UPI00359344E2